MEAVAGMGVSLLAGGHPAANQPDANLIWHLRIHRNLLPRWGTPSTESDASEQRDSNGACCCCWSWLLAIALSAITIVARRMLHSPKNLSIHPASSTKRDVCKIFSDQRHHR